MEKKYYYPQMRSLRGYAMLDQAFVADYLKITRQQYSLYESGKREIPVHLLLQLSQLYGCSVDFILGNSVKSGKANQIPL